MKPATVFLDEMTNLELELFLENHHTVFIPVGATEQHGPHAPLGTDVFLPREIARRVCLRRGDALVAPALPYTLSYPHRGFAGEFSLSIETFMAVVKELAISFAKSGFKRVIFLNGHYDNTYALSYACAQAAPSLPKDCRAFAINHYDGYSREQLEVFGMHAGLGETSMVMAINSDWVDVEKLNVENPYFPKTENGTMALHNAFFFSSPGSVYRITKSGTWGDARGSTAEQGETFFEWGTSSVIQLLQDLEKMYLESEIRQ